MSNLSQRPGVYSDYEASGITISRAGVKAAGLVADCGGLEAVSSVYTALGASNLLGADSEAYKLAAVMLENGAAYVVCSPVKSGDYVAALNALSMREDVYAVSCDNQKSEVIAALKSVVLASSLERREKLGVAAVLYESAQTAVLAAGEINCERIVLVTSNEEADASLLAAAMTGAICAQADPALPMNSVELYGVAAGSFLDEEINTLVLGGVTPVEDTSGASCVVRAVTTRTKTSGVSDITWRELTTIMIVDEVIPAVRTALKSKFGRSKNNAQTRGAVRTQVVLELNQQLKRQIIDIYGDVLVEADGDDPTTCNVGFDFTVAHGLNRIHISAVIEI